MSETTASIELCNCEEVLIQEICDPQLRREDVAQTYAMTLRSSERDTVDWAKVNQAIIDRWSLSALKWIKTRAWKLAGNHPPARRT